MYKDRYNWVYEFGEHHDSYKCPNKMIVTPIVTAYKEACYAGIKSICDKYHITDFNVLWRRYMSKLPEYLREYDDVNDFNRIVDFDDIHRTRITFSFGSHYFDVYYFEDRTQIAPVMVFNMPIESTNAFSLEKAAIRAGRSLDPTVNHLHEIPEYCYGSSHIPEDLPDFKIYSCGNMVFIPLTPYNLEKAILDTVYGPESELNPLRDLRPLITNGYFAK